MKAILKELGFEHLPMLSEFWKKLRNHKEGFEPSYITIEYNSFVEFVTQPLTKGMFIPCDEAGNVLEKSLACLNGDNCPICEQYQQAKDRVLFEGWEGKSYCDYLVINDNQTIRINDDCIYVYPNSEAIMVETIEQAINAGVKLIIK